MYEDCLNLKTGNCEIVVRDEPTYSHNSTDNRFVFDKELFLYEEVDYISSKHSVSVNCHNGESFSSILLAGGGGTGIHKNSALMHDDKLLVAVGNFVCCLAIPRLDILWQSKTDWATCFGVYHSPKHESYISHGELDITRLTYSGEVVWQASGKDIFTGSFLLNEDQIEVTDFNGERYQIDITNGACRLTSR